MGKKMFIQNLKRIVHYIEVTQKVEFVFITHTHTQKVFKNTNESESFEWGFWGYWNFIQIILNNSHNKLVELRPWW